MINYLKLEKNLNIIYYYLVCIIMCLTVCLSMMIMSRDEIVLYFQHVTCPIARCIVKLALHQGGPHIHGDKIVVRKWNVLLPQMYTCNINFIS